MSGGRRLACSEQDWKDICSKSKRWTSWRLITKNLLWISCRRRHFPSFSTERSHPWHRSTATPHKVRQACKVTTRDRRVDPSITLVIGAICVKKGSETIAPLHSGTFDSSLLQYSAKLNRFKMLEKTSSSNKERTFTWRQPLIGMNRVCKGNRGCCNEGEGTSHNYETIVGQRSNIYEWWFSDIYRFQFPAPWHMKFAYLFQSPVHIRRAVS